VSLERAADPVERVRQDPAALIGLRHPAPRFDQQVVHGVETSRENGAT
jgi:hypothetical protein